VKAAPAKAAPAKTAPAKAAKPAAPRSRKKAQADLPPEPGP